MRLYILQTHYRQPIDFTEEGLQNAQIAAERLFDVILLAKAYSSQDIETEEKNADDEELLSAIESSREKFIGAMDEDFNTSVGLATVFDFSREVNDYLRKVDKINKSVMAEVYELFVEFQSVLGLYENIDQYSSFKIQERLISLLIDLRQEFRSEKNWKKSDKIRDTLKQAGIILEDNPKRVLWKIERKNTEK